MTRVVRAHLALLAVVVLVLTTGPSWGTYTAQAIVGAVAAMIVACTACLWPNSPGESDDHAGPSAHITRALVIAALVLTFAGPFFAEVYWHPSNRPDVNALIPWISSIGVAVVVSLLLNARQHRPKLWASQMVLLFTSGAVLRVAAVVASPSPVIDVYTALREAPAHLLHGENPYNATYSHPYDSSPAHYERYPFYPPLPILVNVPLSAVGIDVRFANVFCDVFAAFVLYRLGCSRGRPLAGAMAAATYLHLPLVPFVIAEAWYEPILAAVLGTGLWLVECGRRIGFFLLGVGLTGKQFGMALVGPLLVSLRKRWWLLVVGTVVAAAVVVLPFLLWDPAAFWETVFVAQLQRPPRADAVTIQNGVSDLYSWTIPRLLLWITAVIIVLALSYRTPAQPTAAALWAGTALLTFVLFHTQSFFNYFYLCTYLILLGVLGLIPAQRHEPEA